MADREMLPGDMFARLSDLSMLADLRSNVFLNNVVHEGGASVGLLERTADGYEFLSSDIVSAPVRGIIERIREGSGALYHTEHRLDYWLHQLDPNRTPDATSSELLATVTDLGQLAKIEADFMAESTRQAHGIVRDEMGMTEANWIARARFQAAVRRELAALTENNLERQARLAEMVHLSEQAAPTIPEHFVEAVLERLHTDPGCAEQMQRLHSAALLQRSYRHYITLFRESTVGQPDKFPLQPLKVVARGLARVVTLPNGAIVPREPILRKNCPGVERNFERVDRLFLELLLAEGADFPYPNASLVLPPAYQAFKGARHSVLVSARFAMTHVLDSVIEGTRPQR